MATTRIVLKALNKSDASVIGFLLPLGTRLEDVSTTYNGSPTVRRNPLERDFTITGTAVNTAASPTSAEITDAIDAMKSFLSATGKDITNILVVSHTSASPLGVELSSAAYTTAAAAWTETESYDRAYAATNSRFEVVSYSHSAMTLPVNFDFRITLRNAPAIEVLRVVLKAIDRSDASTIGYLLPAGCNVSNIESLAGRMSEAGVRRNPAEQSFMVQGLATNHATAPTEAEIATAIASLTSFLQSQTKDITEILLVHYTQTTPLGAELSSSGYSTAAAAWTQVKSYGLAYANNRTRYEVIDYGFFDMEPPLSFRWRVRLDNSPRIDTTRIVLSGIETSSDTAVAYLLPVGTEIDSIQAIMRKNNMSGITTSPVRQEMYKIGGLATNQSATPTEAEILTAITGLCAFLTSKTKSITAVLVVDYTNASAVGVELDAAGIAAAAWTVKQTFATSYTSTGARFEVIDYSIDDIAFPVNFAWSATVQNFPIGDADRFDPGNVRSFDFHTSRSTAGLSEAMDIVITARANDGASVSALLYILDAISRPLASVNVKNALGALDSNQTTVTAASIVNTAGANAVVTKVNVGWSKFTKEITLSCTLIGPAGSLARSGGYESILDVSIVSSFNSTQGMKFYDIKRPGAIRIAQQASNPSGTLSVEISLSFCGNFKNAANSAIRGFARKFGTAGLVPTTSGIRYAMSSRSVDGSEMGTAIGTFIFEDVTPDESSTINDIIPSATARSLAGMTLSTMFGTSAFDGIAEATRGIE